MIYMATQQQKETAAALRKIADYLKNDPTASEQIENIGNSLKLLAPVIK
jgi:hypothetical protein